MLCQKNDFSLEVVGVINDANYVLYVTGQGVILTRTVIALLLIDYVLPLIGCRYTFPPLILC
jgi:hypothetical protein